MKYIIAILLTALLLLPVANNVFAQMEEDEEEKWSRYPYRLTLTADGGIGIPFGPELFDELWNETLLASVSLGVVIIPVIEVRGWFAYTNWSVSAIPAHDALGLTGTETTEGGKVTTMLYGASARINPLPDSQMMPFLEVGGGFFQASGNDVYVNERAVNSMENSSGPVFLVGGGMEYGMNETWNVFTQFNYYIGFDGDFSPGELVRPENTYQPGDPAAPANANYVEIKPGNLRIGAILLGITYKM